MINSLNVAERLLGKEQGAVVRGRQTKHMLIVVTYICVCTRVYVYDEYLCSFSSLPVRTLIENQCNSVVIYLIAFH